MPRLILGCNRVDLGTVTRLDRPPTLDPSLKLQSTRDRDYGKSVLPRVRFWRRLSLQLPEAYLPWYSVGIMTTTPVAYERMIERASEQNGFFRTADAKAIGVPPVYLRKLAQTGKLQHRGWGLYRVRAIPPTPKDEYQEALLWAGGEAAIGGEAALALWELADVNPRAVEVVIPPGGRVRKNSKVKVRLIHDRLAPGDIDWVDNIRVVTPAKAIAQTIARGLDGSLIEQAINNGRARQLFTPLTEARLRVRLADREQGTHT